ncbi:uncharacterized protein TNCV_1364871 [Trichonephila clavipes]|nr:uncharacterized protein TNCV_1364871 [Trichonephila clavipes]
MGRKNQYRSRKRKFTESSGNSDEIFEHRIFDFTTLLSVLAVLCCPVCLHDELSLTEDSRCSNFSLKCRNCDFLKGFTSSEKINNKLKLNSLIAFALRVIGKGYTAGNKLFGILDLPFLSKTAFRNQELKIQHAISIVSIESMKNAATERICSKKAKVPDAASNAHVCCNRKGSASSMETVGAYRIFERSENHRKLQYTDYYGDGD